MSEEEINKKIDCINQHKIELNNEELIKISNEIIDLYNKEKEKNKVIEIFRKDMPEDTEIVCMRKEDFERNFGNEYISKEKIRDILNEHFRFYRDLRKQDNYPNEAIISSDCLSRLSMLQTLYLELLEEK